MRHWVTVMVAAAALASCAGETENKEGSSAKPVPKEATAAAAATGALGITNADNRRFWVSFDPSKRSWMGGHTPPASGILRVNSGKYVISADGMVIQDKDGKTVARFYGFLGGTQVGAQGRGYVESPPIDFRWTAN